MISSASVSPTSLGVQRFKVEPVEKTSAFRGVIQYVHAVLTMRTELNRVTDDSTSDGPSSSLVWRLTVDSDIATSLHVESTRFYGGTDLLTCGFRHFSGAQSSLKVRKAIVAVGGFTQQSTALRSASQ